MNTTVGSVYDGFDAIYCISLTTTPDKLKKAKELFKELGFEHLVKYYITKKSEYGGIYGCFESHVNVMKKCYADPNCKNVLIFEDDVIKGAFYNEKYINNAIQFMKYNKDWDILKLGALVFLPPLVCNKKIGICKGNSVYAHAYVVNRKAIKQHIDYFNTLDPVDLKTKSFTAYGQYKYNFDATFQNSLNSYYIQSAQFWQDQRSSNIDHTYGIIDMNKFQDTDIGNSILAQFFSFSPMFLFLSSSCLIAFVILIIYISIKLTVETLKKISK